MPFQYEVDANRGFTMKFELWWGNVNRNHVTAEPYASMSREEILADPKIAEILADLDRFMELLKMKNEWIGWNGIVQHHREAMNFEEWEIIHMRRWRFSFRSIEDFTAAPHLDAMASVMVKMVETVRRLLRILNADVAALPE